MDFFLGLERSTFGVGSDESVLNLFAALSVRIEYGNVLGEEQVNTH